MEHAKPVRSTTASQTKPWALALSALVVTSAWPCSGVGPPGVPVVFGDQTNIIIWDEANKTEHFIRNANFRSGAADFGFIAPTPGKPTLKEASNQAFFTLAKLAPQAGGGFAGGGMGGGGGLGARSRSSEVQVIQEADVAGYHATTLWAKDARPINDWMNEHGYVSTPEVEKWAERYCKKGWYLTAFKVVDKSRLAASTGTVRMSFKTDRPFNPFYVPATNIKIDRKGTLRVYFVAVGDYEANIGFMGPWLTPQWTAKVPRSSADLLAKQVQIPASSVPDNAQVATYVDNDFPRPAPDDIFFTKKEPEVVKPPAPAPVRTIPPLAILPVFLGLGVLVVARRRQTSV